MDRLTRVTLVLAAAFIGCYIGEVMSEGLLPILLLLTNALVGFALAILLLWRLYELLVDWKWQKTSPILIVGATVAFGIWVPVGRIVESFKSPRLLTGYCKHTVSHVKLILRQDRTAELGYYFIDRSITRGSYSLKGDTVVLNFNDSPVASLNSELLLTKTELRELGVIDSTRRPQVFKLSLNKLTR